MRCFYHNDYYHFSQYNSDLRWCRTLLLRCYCSGITNNINQRNNRYMEPGCQQYSNFSLHFYSDRRSMCNFSNFNNYDYSITIGSECWDYHPSYL